VVDELFMNAVRYGSTENKSSVYITFEYDEDEAQFTIEDDGTGPNAIPADKLRGIIQKNEENKDLTRTSGRGLSMITKVWTDQMTIAESEHGGIAISIKKKVDAFSAPPPPMPPTGLLKQAVERAEATPPAMVQPEREPIAAKPIQGMPLYEVKLSGEIDQSNIEEVVAPIHDQVGAMPLNSVLALDFSDVSYINSTFIGNLASWYTAMHKKGGRVILKGVKKNISEVLELVGLLNVIELTK